MNDLGDELDGIIESSARARQTVDTRANQLALAGIAVIWVFHVTTAAMALPVELIRPLAAFVACLGFDLLDWMTQYVVEADPLRVQRWLHEPRLPWYKRLFLQRRQIGQRGTYVIPVSRAFFIAKLLVLTFGFINIAWFLAAHAHWL